METLYFKKHIDNMHPNRFPIKYTICLFLLLLLLTDRVSISEPSKDPHYSKVGFFDIHVCNWPERPLFFMALFSTYNYKNISSIQIYSSEDKLIGKLNLKKYRLLIDKNKKQKRVFIKQIDIATNDKSGWYYTKVNLKDGTSHSLKDFVIIDKMGISKISKPNISQELKDIPKSFTLDKITGALYYKAFIRDEWDSKLIYESKLLSDPKVLVPDKLLKKGGYYSIQVHARDTNEHKLLGDFNHGSLTKKIEFTIKE